MDRLLKISDRTNVVIHALIYIAGHDGEHAVPVRKIATDLSLSVPYLAKVIQPVVKAGLLTSSRGAKGGFRLTEKARDMTLLDIFSIVEGPLPEQSCLFGKPICKSGSCLFTNLNDTVRREIQKTLKNTRLEDLIDQF